MASGILHINQPIKVGNFSTPPASPMEGVIYFDTNSSSFQMYQSGSFVTITDSEALAATTGAASIGYDNSSSGLTAVQLQAAIDEIEARLQSAEGTLSGHLDGTASKHDASEVDYERVDGSKKNIQAASDDVESAITDLDDAIGSLTQGANYTAADATEVASHLAAIDTALATAGGVEFTDSTFRIKDDGDATKKLAFSVGGITTSTVRTVTMPDTDVDLGQIATNTSAISSKANDADVIKKDGSVAFTGAQSMGSFKITSLADGVDAGDAVNKGQLDLKLDASQKGAANGVATLGADSKIPSSQIPAVALVDVNVVASEAAQLALTLQEGDVVVRSDISKTYVHNGGVAGTMADFTEIMAAGAVISVNGASGAVSLDTDDISEGSTNLYYTETRFNTSFSGKSTTDLSEGTNLYHTTARARSAAVLNTLAGSEVDQAPSVSAVNAALSGKLANVVEDLTPQLGGDLDLNSEALMGDLMRSASADATNFILEKYIHSTTLLASQTAAVITALTFQHASYEGCEITYKLKEATTNAVRIGTIRVVTNGTNVVLSDVYTDTADLGVSFDAAVNGADIEIKYTSDTNNVTLRADVKLIKA